MIAAEHVDAPPSADLHDRRLGLASLERVARPGVAVAVLLVPRDAAPLVTALAVTPQVES